MTVDHVSEMAIRDVVIFVAIGQIIFREFEDDGDEYKEFLDCVFGDVALEFLNRWAVLLDNGRLGAFEFGDCGNRSVARWLGLGEFMMGGVLNLKTLYISTLSLFPGSVSVEPSGLYPLY